MPALALLAAVAAAPLGPALAAPMNVAGPASGALVVDLDTGRELFSRRPAVRRLPASVQKLWTTSSALRLMGPDARFTTTVAASRGSLYLRGGGDPTLGTAQIRTLAAGVRSAGIRRVAGRVVGDESVFDSRRGVPSSLWGPSPDVEPLSALSLGRNVVGGRYVLRPARAAAESLRRALRGAGIRVSSRAVTTGRTPAGARTVALLRSPPLRSLVASTNTPSDNFYAETLLKDLGAARGGGGTTPAGAAVVRREAARLGLHPAVVDGSGLSRRDRSSPREVVTLLAAMDGDPDFYASLARFGRRGGTLEDRLKGSPASRACRAKTGTLHDVSALAGYCRAGSGRMLGFAFLMNSVWPPAARILQDRMVGALVRYG